VGNTGNIRVLSLCTGLGMARALDTTLDVVAVEVEAYAQAVICKNAAEETQVAVKALWPDVKTFPAAKFRGCFDYVTAGYPCQPFSVAGKRKGETDPRHLWPYIERIIQTIKPFWCFFENVSGHLTLGFPTVYRSLRNMGYKVEAGLFTAAEVGAPHKRERLFILAKSGQLRRRGRDNGVSTWQQRALQAERPNQLADATGQRIQRSESERSMETKRQANKQSCKWPARPGQQQYEWEEPRTIKSSVGGATNGSQNWVDRLRILGNGVVPQCAEKAFRILTSKVNQL